MITFTHLIIGLILGKLTGNYYVAVFAAVFADLDHIVFYARQKILFNPKKLLKTVTNPKDPYHNQRNYLHSFFGWAVLSPVALAVNFQLGLVFLMGYASHLVLDLIDNSEFYPLYPLKYRVNGPIPYFSKAELVIVMVLFVVLLFI